MSVLTGDIQTRPRRPFSHRVRVRHAETSAGGTVHSASYLAYIEDAVEQWFHDALGPGWRDRIGCAPRDAALHWSETAHSGDTLGFSIAIADWQPTALHLDVSGWNGPRKVVEATITYDWLDPATHEPRPLPVDIKLALSATLIGM